MAHIIPNQPLHSPFNQTDVQEAAIALVREFLNRKGFTETMKTFDIESPRTAKSITNRAQLVQTLHLAPHMRKNKQLSSPYRTMIEVLAWNCLKKQYKVEQESFTVKQETSHEPTIRHTSTNQEAQTRLQSNEIVSPLTPHRNSMLEPSPSRFGNNMNKSLQSNHPTMTKRPSTAFGKLQQNSNNSNQSSNNTTAVVEDVLLDVELDIDDEQYDWLRKEKPNRPAKNRPKSRREKFVQKQKEKKEAGINGGITQTTATDLRELIFGKSNNRVFNDAWAKQNFHFNEMDGLRYGIIQKQGGPCGVLAVVQAFFLKHLIFESTKHDDNGVNLEVNDSSRSLLLAISLTDIIWSCGDQSCAVLAIPSPIKQTRGSIGFIEDGITEYTTFKMCHSQAELQKLIFDNIRSYEHGNGACVMLLYSVIMTRGIDNIRADMDERSCTLVGSHFYCTQELVNLLMTGIACSNVFDNTVTIDASKELKGVTEKCEIGFLTLYEHYKSCEVGENLKTPKYPIWVICSESHYSVLFALDRSPLLHSVPLFDLYYYDGLAHQEEEIKLTVQARAGYLASGHDLVPPIEDCIRTRWPGSKVDWNGTDPWL